MGDVLNDDPWSWKKFFSGIFTGKNYAKSIVLGLCLAIMLSIATLSVYGFLYLKGRLFSEKAPTPDVITAETATIDKSQKTVNETYLPFSNLFSFGSKGKVQSRED